MQTPREEGHFVVETGVKRVCWIKADRIVGSADGEETQYIYVEWVVSGTVHGRPMTACVTAHPLGYDGGSRKSG